MFNPHLELPNILEPSSDPGPHLYISISLPCPCPQSPALWVWLERKEGVGISHRESGGSRSKRGECRFVVGKVVNFGFTQGAKAEGFVISAELALGYSQSGELG